MKEKGEKEEGDICIEREKENVRDRQDRVENERRKGSEEWRGRAGMEGELRWIANSSHINKREDIVCEAAEKPPSLQPPRRSGSPASRGLSKLIKNT